MRYIMPEVTSYRQVRRLPRFLRTMVAMPLRGLYSARLAVG